VLNRDVFEDWTRNAAEAAIGLGLAHLKLGKEVPNETPLGTVLTAPPPEDRELFCRNGLRHFISIPSRRIKAALAELARQRSRIPASLKNRRGWILARELDLAARMAEQSCKFMLWQQARARNRLGTARNMARRNLKELRQLKREFVAFWAGRNKGKPIHCCSFLDWRIADYERPERLAGQC